MLNRHVDLVSYNLLLAATKIKKVSIRQLFAKTILRHQHKCLKISIQLIYFLSVINEPDESRKCIVNTGTTLYHLFATANQKN